MTSYIDLQRRFHDLTTVKEFDPELLTSLGGHRFGSDIGWPELQILSRVVILAEAGAGKTIEMREQAKRLVSEGNVAFFVPLEALAQEPLESILSPDEVTMFRNWKANAQVPGWFFLDSVDELKLNAGKLDRALQRLANAINGNLGRSKVVISCRPYDWRAHFDLATVRDRLPSPAVAESAPLIPSADEVFFDALRKDRGAAENRNGIKVNVAPADGDVHVVAMLPMSDLQIRSFAEQFGVVDPTAFLTEVDRQNAWAFARRPFDLIELIAAWTSSGKLGTRAQQHEANITSKLKDDPDRADRGDLHDVQAREGAERLALALALTRTRTFRAPDQTLDITRAEGVLDAAAILGNWTEAQRQALLRRGLFDPATYGRVRFHHRSVQEFLAAQRLRRLREKGMPTKSLFRLLFSRHYGEEIVFPSMRAIAAWLSLWDRDVLRELMSREPEALLSLGDPESLLMSDRANLVRTFATAYGKGSWRGLQIPIDEIRRLAHPELALLVRELWGEGPENYDVRDLLVDMIWQGPIDGCADLAEAAALDTTWGDQQRAIAVAALIACNAIGAARRLVDHLLQHPEAWPAPTVHRIAPELFPAVLSVKELVILLKRTPEPKQTTNGFSWALREIAQAVDPASKIASSLRHEVAQIIYESRLLKIEFHHIRGTRDYLAPALSIMCERGLSVTSDPDPKLIRACVIASRFGERDEGGTDSPTGLRGHLQHAEHLRPAVFWSDLDLMDELVPTTDEWYRHYHVLHGSLLGSLGERDRSWLEKAVADEAQPRRRPIALHASIELWRNRGALQEDLGSLRSATLGYELLNKILIEQTAPKPQNPEIERIRRDELRRKSVREGREAQRIENWRIWRDELLANPAEAFSPERQQSTVANLYTWLNSLERRGNRYDVRNREALKQAFGPDIARLAEQAFKSKWRSTVPEMWSTRFVKDRNSTPYSWVHGLCGLAAEAMAPGWARTLSPAEARIAAAYAPLELNGFAPFVTDLVQSHPAEVDAVLGDELSSELHVAAEHQHLPALQDLAYSDISVKKLMAPRLLAALETWPSPTEQDGAHLAHHLKHVLRILNDVGDEAINTSVVLHSVDHFKANPSGPLALVWLRGLFRLEPTRGAEVLAAHLASSVDAGERARAVAIFAALFGDRDPVVLRIPSPRDRASVLGELVRSAYAFIRREDDQTHEGVYSPNTRDLAETARNFLLSTLLETPGPEARQEVLGLANEPDFAHFPDRLRLLTRQRAAADAEFQALSPDAIVALESRFEAPPQDRDGLFAVMMDRLEDLAHDVAHHDFTDRRTLRSITSEVEMQRTLSLRLQAKANDAFLIAREEEVADRKETDIRFLATQRGQKAVAEVKLADSYSLVDLERALRSQLVGQYLRHFDCKAGCLLLTFRGDKSYWKHPTAGVHLSFQKAVAYLQEIARSLEADEVHDIRVSVFGLDLTDPVLAPAHR